LGAHIYSMLALYFVQPGCTSSENSGRRILTQTVAVPEEYMSTT